MKTERKTLKNGKLTSISQTLRKEQTPEEKKLWYKFFASLGISVLRVSNKRIHDGFYNVCEELSGILEVKNPISR